MEAALFAAVCYGMYERLADHAYIYIYIYIYIYTHTHIYTQRCIHTYIHDR